MKLTPNTRGISALAMAAMATALPAELAGPSTQSTDCVLPSWSVSSASVTYSDDTFVPGKGIFTLTHVLTNITERIECDLAFNTACRVDTGTPADPHLQYQFQVNIDFGWVVFNKSWTCDTQIADPKRPTFAYGYAEFTMECPAEVTPTMTCKGLDAGAGPLLVNATVWVPELEPEPEPELEQEPGNAGRSNNG